MGTNLKTVVSGFNAIASHTRSFMLTLNELRFFGEPGNAAYIAVGYSRAFSDLHTAVFRSVQGIMEEATWAKLYEPGIITPHVTIGEGIPPDVLPAVKTELSGRALNLEVRIDSFSMFTKGVDGMWRVSDRFHFRE